ncbi:MAG: response regulator transcription factor [Bacteroidales bacterium]|nr:response regulator transcription factor [Bacteroidales bacterium]
MNLGIKLLVAEDDPNMGMILKAYLTQKGYTVFLASDGQSAIDVYNHDDVDACILDVMMPVKDGFAVAQEIRRVDKRIPIIFLTAKTLEADVLKGFEVGADDYITKPFSMEELLARLNATIRRSFDEGKPEKNIFHMGRFVFDYGHRTLSIGDSVRQLTSREADLLRLFALNFNQVVERSSALQKIWKDDSFFAARSMDVYITKLRHYLAEDPTIQIINIHSVGFKLTQVNE